MNTPLRQQFEDACYAYYQRLKAGGWSAAEEGDTTRESLFWRREDNSEMYGVQQIEAAWQGFQMAQNSPWLRAIDEAMVVHHAGVVDPSDDYETAKKKVNSLLCMAQSIGEYFAKSREAVKSDAVGGVRVPKDADEAATMVLLGTAWLKERAPERLRPAQPAPEFDVRRILLAVVPGDGDGLEVYAKSVAEVEDKLAELAVRVDDLEQQLAASAQPAARESTSPDLERLQKDAERYRWLREVHWSKNLLAVVKNPREVAHFGVDLPIRTLLDAEIDVAMAAEKQHETKPEAPR